MLVIGGFTLYHIKSYVIFQLTTNALRGPFWAFGVFGHSPKCQFYFGFSKISNIGGECDLLYGKKIMWQLDLRMKKYFQKCHFFLKVGSWKVFFSKN